MKTVQEWLLKFNQYFNNISSNKAPGLNKYEISVFLSDAQDAVVLALCNGTLGKSFESTEEVTNFLAPLVKQAQWVKEGSNNTITKVTNPDYQIASDSVVFQLPDNVLHRTYEECFLSVSSNCPNQQANVVPVTQDEFWRTRRNPFRRDNGSRVLRLAYAKTELDNNDAAETTKYSELVSRYEILKYVVRYVSRPEPIILTDLSEINANLKIRGCQDPTPCKLDEALHEAILAEAVKLAKAVWNT